MRRMLTMAMALVAWACAALLPDLPREPVTVKFSEHQWVKRGHAKAIAGGEGAVQLLLGMVRAVGKTVGGLAVGVYRVALACADFLLLQGAASPAGLRAGHLALALPAEVKKRFDSYMTLTSDIDKIRKQHEGKAMPQNVGEDFEKKMKEAQAIWNGDGAEDKGIGTAVEAAEEALHLEDDLTEQKNNRSRINRLRSTVADPTLPADDKPEGRKSIIAGYISLGDYVIANQLFQKMAEGNFRNVAQLPLIPTSLIASKSASRYAGLDGLPLVPLTAEERKQVEEAIAGLEKKSLVSIGAGVLEPERLAVVPKVTSDDRLRLRDVIEIMQTGGGSVSYIREESYTEAAAETTPGSPKPEAALSYTEQTANVRTIPVWIPVTTDQLADWPQLRGLIDGRLRYDVDKRIEQQVLWGLGTGSLLQGIFVVAGTQNVANAGALYVSGNDELEHIRLAITLVTIAGYEANAMVIHPLDWFEIVVLKGSDDHYLGQLFMIQDRAPRVWSIDVVESVGAAENSGLATPERRWVVGDWRRGAALLDRMQTTVSVGLNSDDFTKNRRTLLAEARVALPIFAPAAFAWKITQAEST